VDYVRADQARAASRSRGVYLAEADLRKPAKAPGALFDIFLSHASEDAEVINGVRVLLERQGCP
jgi:hypothetical protein